MTAEVPARAVSGMAGYDVERNRGSSSTLVWEVLAEVLAARSAQTRRPSLDVVDVGSGTGGFAVRLAELGHQVTVVDPSPDALAGARWRAAERGVTLTAVQGEAGDLPSLVGVACADLVVCHNVLEYVDEPAAAMVAIARVLRPGGTVSVLAANVVAAVLQRALAGRYADARRLLVERPDPVPGPGPAEPRRFTLGELTELIQGAGLTPGVAHGIRVFSGLLPGAGSDPVTVEALRDLEVAAASYPALRDIAARLHLLGHR